MRKKFLILFLILFLSREDLIMAGRKDIVLVENGKSDYVIVISKSCSLSEEYAAKELQKFIKEISEVEIPIKREDEEISNKMILVGESEKLKELKVNIDFDSLGEEGFIIKTKGDNLILCGGKKRGTLYSVYSFLEEILGCRWYTKKVSFIPKMKKIIIPSLNKEEKPIIQYREVFFTEAFDRDWAVRNKVNGHHQRLDEETGGHYKYSHFVHTFYQLVPPEKYFDTHPEYFALVEGERRKYNAQLCLSNPDVLKIAKEEVFRWIEEDKSANIFSVSQNDCGGWCQCEKCKELDEKEGSPSASIINFVNQIAEEVSKKYPDKYIDTLAYTYSETPPKNIKPHKNVIVRLCHMAPSCDSHPLEKCEKNKKYVENLKKWSKICDNIYIWHYVTNFAHYLRPFPNFNAIRYDIPFYAKCGVKGIFCQGSYAEGGGGEMAELRSYVLAKLLWNPNVDVDKIIEDFLKGVYGKSAKPIKEYFEMLHKKVKEENICFNLYSDPEPNLFTKELITKAEKLFDEAEKLAENSEILERVKLARLPIYYLNLRSPYDYSIEDGYLRVSEKYKKIYKEFKEIVQKNGITQVSEGRNIWDFINKIVIPEDKYKVITLENNFLKLGIVPELGGRIYSLKDKISNTEYLAPPQGNIQNFISGGYEEYSSEKYRAPGWSEIYNAEIIKNEKEQKIVLSTEINSNLLFERTIILHSNSKEIIINSKIKNISGRIQAGKLSKEGVENNRIRIHPEFSFGEFKDYKIYYLDKNKKLEKIDFKKDRGEIFLRKDNLPSGEWLLINKKNGILNIFNPEEINIAHISFSKEDNKIVLELWSKPKILNPGESIELNHKYRILEEKEIKKYLKYE
jgi:hypothetical protein